jgi:hypothetical protein
MSAVARCQAALVTLFAFRQRVHTYTRRTRPSSSIRTFWRFGLKRRRVATIEWLREFPNAGFLPQLKQTLAIAPEMVAGGPLPLPQATTAASRDAGGSGAYSNERSSSAIRMTAVAASRP